MVLPKGSILSAEERSELSEACVVPPRKSQEWLQWVETDDLLYVRLSESAHTMDVMSGTALVTVWVAVGRAKVCHQSNPQENPGKVSLPK